MKLYNPNERSVMMTCIGLHIFL